MNEKDFFLSVVDQAKNLIFLLDGQAMFYSEHSFSGVFINRIMSSWQKFYHCVETLTNDSVRRDIILYAMAAFIDEKILCSDWPCRQAWSHRPLQLQHFNEQLAGEGFFSRLDSLLIAEANDVAVLAFYGWLLRLGFIGKYVVEHQDNRDRLIEKIRHKTQDFLVDSASLCLDCKAVSQGGFLCGRFFRYGLIGVSILLVFLFFFYAALWSSVNSYSKTYFLNNLQVTGSRIKQIVSKDL